LKRLAVLDLAVGTVRYLTSRAGFDDMANDMRWSADGGTLYFQAEVKGRTPIYRIARDAAAGTMPERVLDHSMIDAWQLSETDGSIVYARRAIHEPHELFVKPANGTASTRLTAFNAKFESEIDLRPAQEIWVDGAGDTKIHVFVITPHGFDPARKYPLILNVHGGPQSQWTDAFRGDWQVYPGKGYVVAFANPTGSTGYGQKYCDGIGSDWGGRVFDDLMRVTDALEKLPYVDKERIGAMGWSYGGYMMMWMQGHTDRFKCQAAMMGLFDLRSFYGATEELWFPRKDFAGSPWTSDQYEKGSPSNSVAKFKTPSLVITGELDFRVPYTQSLAYFTALQEQGVPSRLAVFPNAGHWPGWQEMLFYYGAHVDWFHKWLGGEPLGRDLVQWARMRTMPPRENE
jgi:dipeptidyl aminopeptidase/acylaminoacyl peptidase